MLEVDMQYVEQALDEAVRVEAVIMILLHRWFQKLASRKQNFV